ncbi:MAG: type II toxin-antitoxin system antitoxin SocA domain-containing protein [Thermodesulfobacteriota bacterium]
MDTPKYTPNQIADWFLCSIDRGAGDSLTHLELQKLVYYAQAWALALFNRPLFDEDFEAWVHGPALPSLFRRFKGSSWQALSIPQKCPKVDEQTQELLNDILAIYGQHSGKYLESLTHHELPWREARGELPPDAKSSAKIKKETMRTFYADLLKKHKENA